MAPQRHRNSDNPDWPFVRDSVNEAIRAYLMWKDGDDSVDLIEIMGEALIDVASHLRLDAHIYG